MGTEAFLDNQDLWACDLRPATSAVHTSHPHIMALPSPSSPLSTHLHRHATCTSPSLLPLSACQSHLPVLFKLVFGIRDLISWGTSWMKWPKGGNRSLPTQGFLESRVELHSEVLVRVDWASAEVWNRYRSGHTGTCSSCARFPLPRYGQRVLDNSKPVRGLANSWMLAEESCPLLHNPVSSCFRYELIWRDME